MFQNFISAKRCDGCFFHSFTRWSRIMTSMRAAAGKANSDRQRQQIVMRSFWWMVDAGFILLQTFCWIRKSGFFIPRRSSRPAAGGRGFYRLSDRLTLRSCPFCRPAWIEWCGSLWAWDGIALGSPTDSCADSWETICWGSHGVPGDCISEAPGPICSIAWDRQAVWFALRLRKEKKVFWEVTS